MTDRSPDATPTPEERLKGAGLKVTRPRQAVLAVLHDAHGHFSVDDLVDALERRGTSLPRMTVYNVVADLQAAGLVMQADAGPGRALYEASSTWHHHFVCRVCRTVVDVPCVRGRKPCLTPDASFAGEVEEAQIIFRGVCAKCAVKRRRASSKTPSKRGRRST